MALPDETSDWRELVGLPADSPARGERRGSVRVQNFSSIAALTPVSSALRAELRSGYPGRSNGPGLACSDERHKIECEASLQSIAFRRG